MLDRDDCGAAAVTQINNRCVLQALCWGDAHLPVPMGTGHKAPERFSRFLIFLPASALEIPKKKKKLEIAHRG